MEIFIIGCDVDRYQILDLVDEDDWDRVAEMGLNTGKALGQKWRPLKVEIINDEEEPEESLVVGDFPWIGGTIPALSARAAEQLKQTLLDHGELLPLKSKDGEFFAYNVTRVIPALDVSKSEYDTHRNGKIRDVKKYAFIIDALRDCCIFKLAEKPLTLYATDQFVRLVKKSGLKGIEITKVWSKK